MAAAHPAGDGPARRPAEPPRGDLPGGGADRAPGAPAGYLDHASATPLHPAARAALTAALDDGWADPARLHGAGRRARRLLDGAREAVGGVLGVRPDEVHWASSGPAAAQLVLRGALAARARVGRGFVVSAVEHSAVLHVGQWHGDGTVVVPVDADGVVDQQAYAGALRRTPTALASLQWGNGEVGALQPVPEVAADCATVGVPLHVDASAALGRVPVTLPEGVSFLTADARGWGGPPGVGVAVRRTGARWRPAAPDDDGVPPVPLLVAAAAGLLGAVEESASLAARHRSWVERLRAELPARVPDTDVVGSGDPARRLPHLLTASFLYVDGEALVTALDRVGFAVDSGSACTADALEPSHVLAAMGALTHGNIRLSLGRDTRDADVTGLLDVLPGVVAELRARSGVAGL